MKLFALQFLLLPSRQYLDVLIWVLAIAVILHIVFMWIFLCGGILPVLSCLKSLGPVGGGLMRSEGRAYRRLIVRSIAAFLPALVSALTAVAIMRILLQDNDGGLAGFLYYMLIPFAAGALMLVASGIICGNGARRFWLAITAGAAGIAVICAVYCIAYGMIRTVVDREKILFLQNGLPVYFAVAIIPGCLQLLSLIAAGTSVMLAFCFSNTGRKVFIVFAIVFLLSQPVLLVLNLITMPVSAVSISVFILAGSCLLCVFAAVIFLYMLIPAGGIGLMSAVSVFVLFSTAGVAAFNLAAARKSLAEHEIVRSADIEKARSDVVSAREERITRHAAVNGMEVFEKVCSTCHDFASKRVGPPLNAVLPKYENNPEALISFLKRPSRVNPDYPQMPVPPLKPAEREAVVRYLLERMYKNDEDK